MNHLDAVNVVFESLAKGIQPDPVQSSLDWAEENFILVDGPYEGEPWSRYHAPHLIEIFEAIDDEAVNIVSVRKSAQVAFTTAALAWLGKNIDTAPARDLVIFPTLALVQDFNREKLVPAILSSPALSRKVSKQTSRDANGSTALSKRYPGGSLRLTGANSAADLRSKTIKRQLRDEIDEWPQDLDGQGDPYLMADARQIAFHATGDWKVFEGSTPTIKGMSRIDERFELGDQRYFHVPCPGCGEYQRLVFGSKETPHGLKFNTTHPYEAHYVCEHNGCIIEHHQKRRMLAQGKFIAEAPGPGKHPSFHIDAISSNFTTWDRLVEAFLKAKDDPQKLKAFVNLWLGESWEERGDAPEYELIMARREDYEPRHIPPGGLILTGAVDVQSDGMYYEIVAWGRDAQNWSIDIGFLAGDPTTASSEIWKELDEVYERTYVDVNGAEWPVDVLAVDSGYATQAVYLWTRSRGKARAIKGVPGWYKPAIAAAPSKQDINYRGQKAANSVKLWPVGTWPLKSALYYNIRKTKNDKGVHPPGYCHFANFHDADYFTQLTSEYLKERRYRGRIIKEWHANGPNHFHDCRVYNMAMAEHLGLSRLTEAAWDRVEVDRGVREPTKETAVVDTETGEKQKSAVKLSKKRLSMGRKGGFVKNW